MHYVVSGKGSDFPMSEGLAGGFPGSPNAYFWIKNSEPQPGNGVAPARTEPMAGEQQSVDWGGVSVNG